MRSFRKRTGKNVAVHVTEASIYTSEVPIPAIMRGWRGAFGMLNPFINLFGKNLGPADILLHGNELLPVALDIEVVHTPGHTPGSVSFYIPTKETLIVGDAMVHRRGKLYPPHIAFSHDNSIALDSIRKLAQYDCSVVCFSHYPPLVTGAQSRIKEFATSFRVEDR